MISINQLRAGTFHDNVPKDFAERLMNDQRVAVNWQNITPLARNEFICWVTHAKKLPTRARRIEVAFDKLLRGERRPCCWIGCYHRTDKAVSQSVKGILKKSGQI